MRLRRRWERLKYGAWAAPKTPRQLRVMVELLGYLRNVGWLDSKLKGAPVDGAGNTIPWWPYSAITWLGSVLTGEERLFEYGSGHSTLWFARLVGEVHSVEHDPSWVDRLRPLLPANCSLMLRELSELPEESSYVTSIREPTGTFDVIVIDGRDRVACMLEARHHLRPQGLFIVDDAQETRFWEGLEALAEDGFLRIDFQGMAAGEYHFRCTSFLSRSMDVWLDRAPLPRGPSRAPTREPWTF